MILAPNSRLLLLEAIKPPPGFEVDAAIGTTYTLGLDALLIPPASWAAHAARNSIGDIDPILLANTLRLFADRTLVFHQAGFASPFEAGYELLAAFLDGMLYPVVVPEGSTFHPKVWALRFRSETGEIGLRILIGSRNLSLTTTWDVLVRLDSTPDGQISGLPIANLLSSLPGRSTVTISDAKLALLDSLVRDLTTTPFGAPAGATDAEIIYWRQPGTPVDVFPASCDSRLVISPFLGSDGLGLLPRVRAKGRTVLVSRPSSLSTELAAGFDPYTLQTDALDVDDGDEARLGSDLHAKVFAFDQGDHATVIIGSANATWAAFVRNDEVVVRIQGDVADFGVRQILGEDVDPADSDDAEVDLGMLLEPWLDTGETDDDDDEADGRFFEPAIQAIASIRIDGVCAQLEGDRYQLTLTAREPMLAPPGISVEFALLGHADPLPSTFSAGLPASLELDLGDITRLIQVRLSDTSGNNDAVTMVLLADFDPPDRRHIRALRSLLTDRTRFLRFLRYLLDASRSADDASDGDDDGTPGVRSRRRTFRGLPVAGDAPILEPLLRLLAQDPRELRHLQAVIAEFADDAAILPEDFQAIWKAISPLIPQADAEEADHDIVG